MSGIDRIDEGRLIQVIVALMICLFTYKTALADKVIESGSSNNGQCPPGYNSFAATLGSDHVTCWKAQKVLGGSPPPENECRPRQTETECWAVVLMCDDGYYQIGGGAGGTNSWVSCNKYPCGVCFGFGSW